MRDNHKKFVLILILASIGLFINRYGLADEYIQVPGLIDLRTNFSDGTHSLEYLIRLAKKRGFNVLFINDHDRIVLEYGIRPFQNILKKKVEKPSINKGGPENYLNMIKLASKKYPEMILIPGAESAPFYYWKGSYFKRNLTVCDWERHLLIVGLEKPEDYKKLPILHNGYSTKYTLSSISASLFFLFIPLILGLYMIKRTGIIRYSGIIILVFCLLLLINNHPFKSSPYDQYHGDQEISPYQLLIDYANSRGGMVFWNHPETKSGQGKLGPIFRDTPPYPQVLIESKNYTGFAALYGDSITITEPGNIWDQVLIEYCMGKRTKPVWGISSADFHKEGAAGEKLGNFPTIFLVKNKTKKDILDALKKGRMYACRGDVDFPRLILEDFSISDSETSLKGIMGEEIFSEGYPRINILIPPISSEKENSITVRLIRYGKLLKTFSGETPLNINFQDEFFEPGKKIYYRLDITAKKGRKLISNPIFVKFQALKEE
ncbi:MAG: hypothetical protein ACE5WD_10320 [Candidatus Aminicenantia bacterium]